MPRSKTKLGAPISLRIETEIREALQQFADADDRSLSSYIARILRQHVEQKRGKRPKTKS
jgi:hypothetical protein